MNTHESESKPVLKNGDVVRLNSGGPEITICKIDENDNAWCAWFKDGEKRELLLTVQALTFVR